MVSCDNWWLQTVSQELPFNPVFCRYRISLYCHCTIPVSFLTRTSGVHDLHLHVLTRLPEEAAVCCSVQNQLAETHWAFFQGKFIDVLSFHLLRSKQAMLFITYTCETCSESFNSKVFLEQVSQMKAPRSCLFAEVITWGGAVRRVRPLWKVTVLTWCQSMELQIRAPTSENSYISGPERI